MIGFIQGEVLFSDGHEVVLNTASGIGYQVYFHRVLAEGGWASLYISHVIKEAAEDLYGFETLRDKKMFELLISVKGVGPKSAYALMASIATDQIIEAISLESKKTLTSAPGVGPKAAAQILLDLGNKIHKVKMYSSAVRTSNSYQVVSAVKDSSTSELVQEMAAEVGINSSQIMNDALMACKELGFKEENIIPLAQKILGQHQISKPEQLVHLVLKEV